MVDLAEVGRRLVERPPVPPSPPEQLVRRCRRRRIRRMVAATAAASTVGAALATLIVGSDRGRVARVQVLAPGHATTVPAPEAATPNVLTPSGGAVNLMATGPASAWADNGIGFYVTRDRGFVWADATPPPIRGDDVVADVSDVAASGPDDLWIAWFYHHSGGPTRISRSVDGGRTWRTGVLPGQTSDSFGQVFLSFADRRLGWAVAGAPGRAVLLHTVDGGASWQVMGTAPVVGPITFTDATRGWAASQTESNPGLWRTVDGGRSWVPVRFGVPAALRVTGQDAPVFSGLPFFFDREHGVLAASFHLGVDASGPIVIYDTADGGASWTAHQTPTDRNSRRYVPYRVPFSAVGPRQWFLYIGPSLYVTEDAGRAWKRVDARPATPDVEGVAFVSGQAGWALLLDQTCAARAGSPAADYCTYPVVFTTADGGRQWFPTHFPNPAPGRTPPARS